MHGVGYLVAGGREVLEALNIFLAKGGVETAANPDVYIREYLSFGIDDARELRERAHSRAVLDIQRIFIIVTPTMTVDAQNALLKTLEEPPAGALFFLVVPSPSTLVPTLRSRMQTVSFKAEKSESMVDVEKFLAATIERRLDMLKLLYERTEDERDLRGAIAFLQHIEGALAPRIIERSVRDGVEAIYRARKYVTDKGAILKPLLEQVALLVPRK